ncbi:MAG: DOMON-like domain-containing protein [Sphingomonadaceae bacterium]|nr:DOMON-like domain-containing protein [Sphingomonadaceae bacterium]
MKIWLETHPKTPQDALISLCANVARRDPDHIAISFLAAGGMERVRWPGDNRSGHENWKRSDDLWKHSCFEAFGRAVGEPCYLETNFATSGDWAAYAFYDYREGMRRVDDIRLIQANWRVRERHAELHALLQLPRTYRDMNWELGLAAVIEERNGNKSYWALSHPTDKPDFHHPDSFTLELPAPDAS